MSNTITILEPLAPAAATDQARRDALCALAQRAHEADMRYDHEAVRAIDTEALAITTWSGEWAAYRLGHAQGALLVATIHSERLHSELAWWKQHFAEEATRLKADVEYWKALATGKAGTV